MRPTSPRGASAYAKPDANQHPRLSSLLTRRLLVPFLFDIEGRVGGFKKFLVDYSPRYTGSKSQDNLNSWLLCSVLTTEI